MAEKTADPGKMRSLLPVLPNRHRRNNRQSQPKTCLFPRMSQYRSKGAPREVTSPSFGLAQSGLFAYIARAIVKSEDSSWRGIE
jgi:hypothetical protein